MNAVVEAKVHDYLTKWYHYDPYDCGTILTVIRKLARVSGHELDHRFAHAGLSAGPEARVASRIVDRATLGGGDETTDYSIKAELDEWLVRNPSKGLI